MRGLVFVLCALVLVLGQFRHTYQDAERYGYLTDIMPADWKATNVWLDTTDCAAQRGAWLALCEDGKLVPMSERAIADDPGHALILDLWSMATQRRAALPEVARLNALVDTLGLLALAGLLFALRAYLTSLTVLWLGPLQYLGWMGTSPHWAYIGLVSLVAVLPLAVAGRATPPSTCSRPSDWPRTACRTRSISAWASCPTSGTSATTTSTARRSRPRPRRRSCSARPNISA
ncbi:MAG: hypothetical protein FJX11_10685 [Alphaproteobacteria bacterium]|nr:hypothetical protein [Alphaproteobacteria bacterium]